MPYLPWIAALAILLIASYLFSGQLAHPEGWLGREWMPRLLNDGNKTLLDAALAALDARPGELIADIGFGGGYSIERLVGQVAPAKPIGVEVSETMVDLALERWDDAVDLYLATVTAMPLTTASLDGALTVNTIYFWKDPEQALAEIRRTLKSGGRLVLGVRTGLGFRLSPISWFRFRIYSQTQLDDLLRRAGFAPAFDLTRPGTMLVTAIAV
jgi:ubiquinone/menaquinone biosynthesis C-methylase UbiE